MIKKYNEFVNESLTKNDVYPYILKGAMEVWQDLRGNNEYIESKIEDGCINITMSGVKETPMNELHDVATFLILPDNFKPNIAIGLDSSYRKGMSIEKCQFLKSDKIVELGKTFYKTVKNENGYNDITSIYLIVKY